MRIAYLSIDPGLRRCGAAAWNAEGGLLWARLIRGLKDTKAPLADTIQVMTIEIARQVETVGELIIELPQVYPGIRQKGDQNDLINLAAIVGSICGKLSTKTTIYKPAQWKGQVPKEITEKRTRQKLSTNELALIELPAKSEAHNVWDAIGLGLFHITNNIPQRIPYTKNTNAPLHHNADPNYVCAPLAESSDTFQARRKPVLMPPKHSEDNDASPVPAPRRRGLR